MRIKFLEANRELKPVPQFEWVGAVMSCLVKSGSKPPTLEAICGHNLDLDIALGRIEPSDFQGDLILDFAVVEKASRKEIESWVFRSDPKNRWKLSLEEIVDPKRVGVIGRDYLQLAEQLAELFQIVRFYPHFVNNILGLANAKENLVCKWSWHGGAEEGWRRPECKRFAS